MIRHGMTCIICKIKKPLSEFPTTKGYFRKQCKPCYVEIVHSRKQMTAAGRIKNIERWNKVFPKESRAHSLHHVEGLGKAGWPRVGVDRGAGDHLTYDEMVTVSQALKRFRAGINPKTLVGSVKVSLSKLPPAGVIYGSRAMMDGADKYTPYNFRDVKVSATVYADAMLRHIFAWFDREDIALDSRVHHLGHLIACAAIVLDSLERGNLIDDRPTAGPSSILLSRLNAEIKSRAAKKRRNR